VVDPVLPVLPLFPDFEPLLPHAARIVAAMTTITMPLP
jgi:hypothetical protein